MVGLLLEKGYEAKIVVEVGFFQNKTVPSLRYHLFDDDIAEMDANALKEIIEVAESNINGIYCFDKQYNYDCQASITNDVTITKFCCDDETDNKYFVEFPKQPECSDYNKDCTLCGCYRKCLYDSL